MSAESSDLLRKRIDQLESENKAQENQLVHAKQLFKEFGIVGFDRGDTENQLALAAAWSLVKRTPVEVGKGVSRHLQVQGTDPDVAGNYIIMISREEI